jgi:hypothetical protein
VYRAPPTETDVKEEQRKSKLLTDATQVKKESNIHHIDIIYRKDDRAKKNEHSQFIACECIFCGIPTHGNSLEEWREMLQSCIEIESHIKFLHNVQKWHEDGKTTVPLVEFIELLIPCILHLENRVGEKILTTILHH